MLVASGASGTGAPTLRAVVRVPLTSHQRAWKVPQPCAPSSPVPWHRLYPTCCYAHPLQCGGCLACANGALHRSQCLTVLLWVLALPLLNSVARNAGCTSSLGTLEAVLLLVLLRPEHSARDALCSRPSLVTPTRPPVPMLQAEQVAAQEPAAGGAQAWPWAWSLRHGAPQHGGDAPQPCGRAGWGLS